MAKRIELEVEGVKVTARLNEDAAPNSSQRLWDALPIEETLRHVRWSGSAAYILAGSMKDANFPYENRTNNYHPATIAYKPEHGEFAFSYGQAEARDTLGFGWATDLAVIEGDTEAWFDVCKRTQSEGRKTLTIRRKES
jgi:hypothetical protein